MKPATDATYIHTYSGRRFYPLAPSVDDIVIDDIAHALALQCRYAGHTREFYSVAEHSARVSLACGRRDALWGLLHDAPEAYLHDLPSPIKYDDGMEAYRQAEARLMAAVVAKFELAELEPASVRRADNLLLHTEARDLLSGRPEWADVTNVQPHRIKPLTPGAAEHWFRQRFRELTKGR